MAVHTCYNCVYGYCDPEVWLRDAYFGRPLVVQCANHPWWPGRMHDVPGVPCRNYRPKAVLPGGDAVRLIPLGDGFYAYVDAADYEWLNQWSWHLAERIRRPERERQDDPHASPDHAAAEGQARGPCGRQQGQQLPVQSPRLLPPGEPAQHAQANGAYPGSKACSTTSDIEMVRKVPVRRQIPRLRLFRRRGRGGPGLRSRGGRWFGEFARLNFPEEWPPERCARSRRMGGIREEKTPGSASRRTRDRRQRTEGGRQRDKPAYGPRVTSHGPRP